MGGAGATDWGRYQGRVTCLAGEVNRGKTQRLAQALEAALAAGQPGIVVLDLAPERVRGIGGKLAAPRGRGLTCLTAAIAAPRLSGRSPREVLALARANAGLAEELFERVGAIDCRALFINDVSLYLQAGDPGRLLALIARPESVVINGYYGTSLGGGELGERERLGMERLFAACDEVVRL